MRIGIDISQTAYDGGVSKYLTGLVQTLLKIDNKNEYVLFFSSFRRKVKVSKFNNSRVKIKTFRFPPALLDLLWNKLHILPIEWLIGNIDVFITSDWTEPPSKASKATILYDLVVYKAPKETASKIVKTQKRKLKWAKKESSMFFCISESSKKDARELLGIEENRLKVIYPGV